MKRNLINFAIFALLALLLAACGTQAKKGAIYVAGDKATIATVINLTRIHTCDVAAGTVAYGDRETYFDIFEGSAGNDRILLTQIVHDGSGCSDQNGGYDFIREDPAKAGWTKMEEGTVQWINAAKKLCKSDRTKSTELQKICDSLK